MATISLANLVKTYPNGFQAVKGVSLDIADGEFIVLVGPSGCGKTTTLRMIAGLEDVTSGTISIGGRVVNDVHPKDRDIAMVFQNYALYPHMTVFKNMAFALMLRKTPRDEIDRRVKAAAAMLGIEALLDRKPGQLSGGQRQRVAVGRAIVREPKAFLFDEPLSNLDARLRVTTRAELKALQLRLKTTTVYVTHDQEEAMTMGDRIVVMYQGIVQQVGTPLDVYRRPVNRFVAGFLGTPPMNFIEGELRRGPAGPLTFVERGSPAGITVSLSPAQADRLAEHLGRPVTLGLRPQAIVAADATSPATLATPSEFSLPVSLVEPLGDAMDVTLRTPAGASLVARVRARDGDAGVRVGSAFRGRVEPESLAVFEPGDTGRNLLA
ncbi:MAG: sn-glycerol-3-phosphate ABC transporter ATP-binding protein UgpC [Phycisphaerae bacterium]|nr:sn-glycerol-3-phosphate ABC transporter ATP-binding protein UgpC [Phycisphaerae bacterium]